MSVQSLSDETWLPVVGYEGFYEVSTQGRVKALPKSGLKSPRIVSVYVRDGRATVTLNKTGDKPHNRRVDELVLEAHVGPRPRPTWGPKEMNDNKLDVRLENLAWEAGMARATGNHRNSSRQSIPLKAAIAAQHISFEEDPDEVDRIEVDEALVEELAQIDHEVQEWRVFRSGEAEVIVDPDGLLEIEKVVADGEGAEFSTPRIELGDVPDLIRCLRAVAGADYTE
jgi:hypothetical protein